MAIEQISVFVENRPGALAEVTALLGGAGIDLRALSIADTENFGILRLIVSEPRRALEVLRAAEYVGSATPVFAVSLTDAPGSLAGVLRVLADADINLEYLYAFITRQAGHAYVVLRVTDNDRAEAVFAEKGVALADHGEIFA
ncbi:MAG: ACT domain-containing protein [Gracilibacteraceae bacterium]|jgi:hypothetical protein|nr:ACT domain-containing protein [Gracilibacteraceae bacterium]